MGWFTDLFSGRKKEVILTPISYEQKKAVANPLSTYLSNSVGKGVPRWQGNILPTMDEMGASVSPFLSKTVDQLYGDIEKNAVASFKNSYSDILESSAGALTSSSRAYNDKMATTELSLGLADKRAALELSLPQAQYNIAAAQKNAEAQLQYQDWLKSLPEYNPILDKALAFLNDQVSTGTDYITSLYGGQSAAFWDILMAAGSSAGSSAGSALVA